MDLDPEALDAFRRKLRYKACYHLGSFCPDVEDLVQETLTRFLAALRQNRLRSPDSMGAFLNGICNNVISEYRRRLWRESGAGPLPHLATVSPEAEWIEMDDAIAAALSQMSHRDCDLLRAFFLQEKDKDQICHVMGMTDAQFRVALFRAKDRFRKIYQQGLKRLPSGAH